MSDRSTNTGDTGLVQEVKADLDGLVVTIELTLISIIQGVALAVLASTAVDPIIHLRWEFWPYIATGLLTILIFWSRAVIHTLSFIDWPLELVHNFLYFGATLLEAVAFTQLANTPMWFLLNALYAAAVWLLFRADLHMLGRHEGLGGPAARRLLDEVRREQLRNVRVIMPLAFAYHLAAWAVIVLRPHLFLDRHWHLALAAVQVVVGFWYLRQGLPLLSARDGLIYQRYLERRAGTAARTR